MFRDKNQRRLRTFIPDAAMTQIAILPQDQRRARQWRQRMALLEVVKKDEEYRDNDQGEGREYRNRHDQEEDMGETQSHTHLDKRMGQAARDNARGPQEMIAADKATGLNVNLKRRRRGDAKGQKFRNKQRKLGNRNAASSTHTTPGHGTPGSSAVPPNTGRAGSSTDASPPTGKRLSWGSGIKRNEQGQIEISLQHDQRPSPPSDQTIFATNLWSRQPSQD